ncbi:MAG TPA: CCA tRNA nucleotidyltransferase [Acidisarcina sp.]
MPDYVYFLENRLSSDQQYALNQVRDAAREAGMTVFLTGGAVRDLTSGSPVRDLDFSVQGNALKLKKTLEKKSAIFWGEHDPSQTLFLRFPGGARVEISAIRQEEHPKPGKVVYHPGTILDDLRRRDFTANAMALSLNEGSYGLLMDPLNGVADIESRLLRLVSNYGFIEEPVRLIRAARLLARLGWQMDEKTQTRFQNAKEEGMITTLSAYHRGYELQEIGHEEDGLKILRVLEAEGWMTSLFPAWTSASADVSGLDQLREVWGQLQMQGVNPDTSAAQMQLLTAKLPEKEIAALKHLFVRQGFVNEWERLQSDARDFAKVLSSKQASQPSEIWKLLTSSNAEAILWLGLTSKAAGIQAKYNSFFNVWPEARGKIPYALLQEMRITPELPGYQDILKQIFLQLIDGGLDTEEKMRAFLEPFSPPAPPPPVSIRRTRGKKTSGARARAEIDDDDEDGAPGRHAGNGEDDDKEDKDEEDDSAEELPIRLPSRETIEAAITAEEDEPLPDPPLRSAPAKPEPAAASHKQAAAPENSLSGTKTPAKGRAKPPASPPSAPAGASPAAAPAPAVTPIAVAPASSPAQVVPEPDSKKQKPKPAGASRKEEPGREPAKAAGKPAPDKPAAKLAPGKTPPAVKKAASPTKSASVKKPLPSLKADKRPSPGPAKKTSGKAAPKKAAPKKAAANRSAPPPSSKKPSPAKKKR